MAKQRVESTMVDDGMERNKNNASLKKLQVYLKMAAQSRTPTSWMLLRGKERRNNIKEIMDALERGNHAEPCSVEHLASLKRAMEGHGEATITTNGPTASNRVFNRDGATRGTNGDRRDAQSVLFYFGNDYGNQAFLDLAKELKSADLLGLTLPRDIAHYNDLNTAIEDSKYLSNDVMQLSSEEDMLDEFLKGRLL